MSTVNEAPTSVDRFTRCIEDLEASRLRLNPDKTPVLWLWARDIKWSSGQDHSPYHVPVLSSSVQVVDIEDWMRWAIESWLNMNYRRPSTICQTTTVVRESPDKQLFQLISCSKCRFMARTHALTLGRHWSMALSMTLCLNSAQPLSFCKVVWRRYLGEVGKFYRTLCLIYPRHCISIFSSKSVKYCRSYDQEILVCSYAS